MRTNSIIKLSPKKKTIKTSFQSKYQLITIINQVEFNESTMIIKEKKNIFNNPAFHLNTNLSLTREKLIFYFSYYDKYR